MKVSSDDFESGRPNAWAKAQTLPIRSLDKGTMKNTNGRQLKSLEPSCKQGQQDPPFDPSRINEAAFSYYRRLAKVRDYVPTHYSGDLSLETVAKVAGLEPKYFSSFFRSKVGVRYMEWLHYVRIQKAAELLRKSNESITSIARQVGYRELRTFQRAFKKMTGTNARMMRKAARPC